MRNLSGMAVIIGLLLVSLLIVQLSSRNPASASNEHVYLALGDSIAAGIASSYPDRRGYPALLRQLIQTQRLASDEPAAVQLVNLAELGETTSSFLEDGQLEAALEAIAETADNDQHLNAVTLTLGGNDLLAVWDLSPAEREARFAAFEDDYAAVVDDLENALQGFDTTVVVTTYYDLTEGNPEFEGSDSWWLARFNSVITETSTDAGFAVVDLEEIFRDRISELTWFPADVHPNNAGHREIARAMWQATAFDDVEPSVEITRPESAQGRSLVPTIHAVTDDNIGVEQVALYVDGEFVESLVHVAHLGSHVGVWDGREHAGEDVEFTVVAVDIAGNEARDSLVVTLPLR